MTLVDMMANLTQI
jgi:hypothetical protein